MNKQDWELLEAKIRAMAAYQQRAKLPCFTSVETPKQREEWLDAIARDLS